MLRLTLPEKEWFSFEDIAARWQVDINTVAHYVWDLHLLRPAFVMKELAYGKVQHFAQASEGEGLMDDTTTAYKSSITYTNGSAYEGKFLYVKTAMPSSEVEHFALFKEFKFTVDLLPNSSEVLAGTALYYEPLGECFTDFSGEQLYFSMMVATGGALAFEKCIPGIPISNEYLITREERDRFEALYRKQEIQKTGKRQEENSLYALGMMAILLAEKSKSFKIGERPNSEQISRAVNDLADRCDFDPTALKSLHKKIADGLRLIDDVNVI